MSHDIEALAEAVHEAYLTTCKRLGWAVKPSNQVPYAELSEDSKELDRASVRAVLACLEPKHAIDLYGAGHLSSSSPLEAAAPSPSPAHVVVLDSLLADYGLAFQHKGWDWRVKMDAAKAKIIEWAAALPAPAAPSPLRWSKEAPNVAGWYWCRFANKPKGGRAFYEVRMDLEDLPVWEVDEEWVPVDDLVEWAGPYHPPEPQGTPTDPAGGAACSP